MSTSKECGFTVSVVIPVYNRLCYLGETIQSVLDQSLGDWELIIVDDGSDEDVRSLLAYYSIGDLLLVRQENQGNAVARNTGIERARGRYVICLDSDDVLAPQMLESCVEELDGDTSTDVVYVQVQRINGEGNIVSQAIEPKPRNGNLLEHLLLGFPLLPSSALVRRECFERWGMYTPGLDDWELWLRWAARGCNFRCIERALLFYRIHDHNLHIDWPRRRDAHYSMLDAFYQMDNLPARALELRRQAYLNQFLYFALSANALGRLEDYGRELARMLAFSPELILDPDFFVTIACAKLDARGKRREHKTSDFQACESQLRTAIDLLFSFGELDDPLNFSKNTLCSRGYLAIGRLAYSAGCDRKRALRLLLRSCIEWPMVVLHTDWMLWYLRAFLGKENVLYLKRLKQWLTTRLT